MTFIQVFMQRLPRASRAESGVAGVALAASFVGLAIGLMVLMNFFGPIANTIEGVKDPDGNDSTKDTNLSSSTTAIINQLPLVLAGAVIVGIVVIAFKFADD